MFAGDAEQAELLEAELRWATSCEGFRKTIEEKYGDVMRQVGYQPMS